MNDRIYLGGGGAEVDLRHAFFRHVLLLWRAGRARGAVRNGARAAAQEQWAARVERVGPRLFSSHGGSRAAPRGLRLSAVGGCRSAVRAQARRAPGQALRCRDETACVHSVRGWQTRCLGLFFQDPAELAPCKTLASCVRAAVRSSGDSCRASSNV